VRRYIDAVVPGEITALLVPFIAALCWIRDLSVLAPFSLLAIGLVRSRPRQPPWLLCMGF
jgi:hypothetical protein